MIEVFINNKSFKFEKIITVLQACEQANEVIPRFCYHEKLSIAGSCRMCLVEIEKSPKPVASCAMPIAAGMVIFTKTPLVKKAQESVLELLLINHPLDCPICDQAGECDLQDITLNFGTDRSRFLEIKRGVEDKYCGPIVKTIMTRCIHCTRCIRFLTELTGVDTMGSTGRGESMEIGTYLNKFIKTELSGNLVDICPVGALTSKPYSFLGRNWELKKIESIDFSDALGSNILIQTRNNGVNNSIVKRKNLNNSDNILRILPKSNDNINEVWISDKTRYAFDGNNKSRLKLLFLKGVATYNWSSFLSEVSTYFSKILRMSRITLGITGTILSVEEVFFFFKFLKYSGSSNFLINNISYKLNNDLPLFYQYNSSINLMEDSDLILLIGINPRIEASMLNLKIRKHFFNKNIPIYLIGSYFDFNYAVNHLGNSVKTLLNIVEGKHSICKKLRKASNPLIIVGSEFSLRQDALTIQNLIRFLSKKSFLLFKNKCNLNFVLSNIAHMNYMDLGLNSNARSFIHKKRYKKNRKYIYFANNLNEMNFKDQAKGILFCSLNTHRLLKDVFIKNKRKRNTRFYRFVLPIKSFYERDSININIEGVVQKAFKSITPVKLSANSENIFRAMHITLSKTIFKRMPTKMRLTNKLLYDESPFIQQSFKIRKKFILNFLIFKENSLKIKYTTFKPLLKNFYMMDNITKYSTVMANCSLFLNNKINFNKIY